MMAIIIQSSIMGSGEKMLLRPLKFTDLSRVRELHEKNHPELGLPAFDEMLNAFIVEDDNNEIVMVGGVEQVGEVVSVTNKEMSKLVKCDSTRKITRI